MYRVEIAEEACRNSCFSGLSVKICDRARVLLLCFVAIAATVTLKISRA